MNVEHIQFSDLYHAVDGCRTTARYMVRQALDRRTGRKHKRFTENGRRWLVLAKQQGMASVRFKRAIDAEIARLTAKNA